MKRFATVLGFVLLACNAFAGEAPTPTASKPFSALPKLLPAVLDPAESTRESQDLAKYPTLMKYLGGLDLASRVTPSDPRNVKLIPTSHVYLPSMDDWKGFWKASSTDKLTCLRAFGMLARKIKKEGVVVFGPGSVFERSVAENKVDLGLALPAHNIGTAIWSPNPSNPDPEFEVHIRVFYTEAYTHQFPDDVLPANLKIGYGDPESYWLDGKEFKQPTIDADIYYGPHGVGFKNVKGVGGQKRGFMGFLQKLAFFLPDAVSSMTINEHEDTLVTEAIINTTVEKFEKTPIYAIKEGK
jgi:hypothetical protein